MKHLFLGERFGELLADWLADWLGKMLGKNLGERLSGIFRLGGERLSEMSGRQFSERLDLRLGFVKCWLKVWLETE